MATASVDQGFATTITFGSSFLGSILSVSGIGASREGLDTTHMGATNGWATMLASDIKKMKPLKVSVHFDTSKYCKTRLGAAAETITITFPVPAGGTTAGTIACSGFLSDFEVDDPHDDVMTADAEITFTGEPTFVAAT